MSFPNELFEKCILFATSNYYLQWKPILLKLLKDSRDPKIYLSSEPCIIFQLEVLHYLLEIENQILALKKDTSSYSFSLIYLKRIRKIIKDIMDGLVWRILDFNRPLIVTLSYNKSPGYLKSNISKEDDAAIKLMNSGHYVIINDLTNILRIGDLLSLNNEGEIKILEVKKQGEKVLSLNDYINVLNRGGALTDQACKVMEANYIINSGVALFGNDITPFLKIDLDLDSMIETVHSICLNSLKNGESSRFIERSVFIRALSINLDKKINIPIQDFRNWLYFSSLYTLYIPNGEVIRYKVPYSVFPFSEELVLNLLSGEIILDTFLNIQEIKKQFKKSGWDVKYNKDHMQQIINNSNSKPYNGKQIFNELINIPIFEISKKNGFHNTIPSQLMELTLCDFYKPNIHINTAEYLMRLTESSKITSYVGIRYTKERELWV